MYNIANGEHVLLLDIITCGYKNNTSFFKTGLALEMPNKHTTNGNVTKVDGNGQRNGLTNARSIVIVHEKRNSCLLELVVIINFYGGEKIRGRENGEKATAGL